MSLPINVLADFRWPVGTGIRRVQDACVRRAPDWASIHNLEVQSSIGSPISTFALSSRLLAERNRYGKPRVFWNPGFVPPLPRIVPSVVTVHDLIHLHYYSKLHVIYYQQVFKPLFLRCNAIVCVSEFTRNEFLNWSGMDESRVFVVPNGVEKNFSSLGNRFEPNRPYVFYAGNRRSYKNVPLLVDAFFKASLHTDGFDLYLTGGPSEDMLATADRVGGADHLKFLGFVSDEELVGYYKGAHVVAFLSEYEGFGLPILEAMACSAPLLLANRTSLPEVAGESAHYVDPSDIDDVVSGLRDICGNSELRTELISSYSNQLGKYSLDKSAGRLWDLIGNVALGNL